jgi:hypothetical protein
MIKKISLPVSAQEWAASASIEAEPVSAAAADFAIATTKFAPNAMSTVRPLSDPPGPAEGTGAARSAPPWSTAIGQC